MSDETHPRASELAEALDNADDSDEVLRVRNEAMAWRDGEREELSPEEAEGFDAVYQRARDEFVRVSREEEKDLRRRGPA